MGGVGVGGGHLQDCVETNSHDKSGHDGYRAGHAEVSHCQLGTRVEKIALRADARFFVLKDLDVCDHFEGHK